MNIPKAYRRFRETGKASRKFKKILLGRRLTKKQIGEKFLGFEVIHHQKHIYEGTVTSEPFFCPWCGCEATRSTGNRVSYPELWERVYCLRCGKLVCEADNSTYYHVIEEMLQNVEDADNNLSRKDILKKVWLEKEATTHGK